jgi:hypothetical protein
VGVHAFMHALLLACRVGSRARVTRNGADPSPMISLSHTHTDTRTMSSRYYVHYTCIPVSMVRVGVGGG